DAILGLARDRPVLMRQHMAGLLQAEGFVPCPEQRRLAELLSDTVARHGSSDTGTDYPMLRALLMGAVFAALMPGAPMELPVLRAELFKRYRLDWEMGVPPGTEAPGGTREAGRTDLSRFFATGPAPECPVPHRCPGPDGQSMWSGCVWTLSSRRWTRRAGSVRRSSTRRTSSPLAMSFE